MPLCNKYSETIMEVNRTFRKSIDWMVRVDEDQCRMRDTSFYYVDQNTLQYKLSNESARIKQIESHASRQRRKHRIAPGFAFTAIE